MRNNYLCVTSLILLLVVLITSNSYCERPDELNHWAKEVASKWEQLGLLKGRESGRNELDSPIKRSEFVALVNRVLNLKDKVDLHFSDVPKNSWYADDVAKSYAAKIIEGHNGEFKPDSYITRQEAAVILYRAYDIKVTDKEISKKFFDSKDIDGWANDAICALLENKYITGREGNAFAPKHNITRAETIKMIDNIMCELKNKAGTYTGNIEKNVVVNTEDVVLKNMIISGNLYLSQGIGEGNVTLDNVTVNGDVIVRGGGENSILIKNSEIKKVLRVLKTNGKVRVVLQGSTEVSDVEIKSGAILKEEKMIGRGFEKVHIIDKWSQEQEVKLEGTFTNVVVDVPNTILNIIGGNVKILELNAKTKVLGSGKIDEAIINSKDITIEQKPGNTTVANELKEIEKKEKETSEKSSDGGGGDITPSKSNQKRILAFAVTSQVGSSIIDDNNYTVTFNVPSGTSVTGLIPNIRVSNKATISPATNTTQNFTLPVTYTVTAEDGTKKEWIVTCIVEQSIPVITLNGSKSISIYANGTYTDAGATALDDVDGNITGNIITTISNDVNGSTVFNNTVPATYTFHYNVMNSLGKKAKEVTRTVIVKNAVCITDFGAHSIDEAGFENFNSSTAIQSAVNYARDNNIEAVDLGGKAGTFYAMDISLRSNIKYINTKNAELKAVGGTPIWHSVLKATNVENITIDGIRIDGNMITEENPGGVAGDDQEGVGLIWFKTCSNVTVTNCYLHDNWYGAIIMQGTNNGTFKNNLIVNVDCGIISTLAASNYLLIDNNEIIGHQMSEGISIYNNFSNGYAHHITITNNKCRDKRKGHGIFVQNAHDVLIEGNEVYNCDTGIGIGEQLNTNKLSYNIIVRDNYLHDNRSTGAYFACYDTLVEDNRISNTGHSGIMVKSADGIIARNVVIRDNTVTNSNSKRAEDSSLNSPSILISQGINCVIENNKINDTRDTALSAWGIWVGGEESGNNIILNNTVQNRISGIYDYFTKAGTENIIKGAVDLLDQASRTVVLNNSSVSTGVADSNTRTITAGEANNTWHKTSDIIVINQKNVTAYHTISPSWVGRQFTVKIARVGTTSIVSGGNINLIDGRDFIPAAPNATITFVYDGTRWNEVHRNESAVTYLDITSVDSEFEDISTPDDLPTTVKVTLSDGATRKFEVDWFNSYPTYKRNVKGTYVFIGRPVLPNEVTNTTNKVATVNIVVD